MALVVACTALGNRIIAGHPNKDNHSLRGGGEDVTSYCLKAIIEFVGEGNTKVVTIDGKPGFEIEIRKVTP